MAFFVEINCGIEVWLNNMQFFSFVFLVENSFGLTLFHPFQIWKRHMKTKYFHKRTLEIECYSNLLCNQNTLIKSWFFRQIEWFIFIINGGHSAQSNSHFCHMHACIINCFENNVEFVQLKWAAWILFIVKMGAEMSFLKNCSWFMV